MAREFIYIALTFLLCGFAGCQPVDRSAPVEVEQAAQPDLSPLASDDVQAVQNQIERSVQFFEQRLERNPRDLVSTMKLGQLYQQRAQLNHDHDSARKAVQTLRQALSLKPGYRPAQICLAAALNTNHEFTAAREMSLQILQDDPENIQALEALGDACLELRQFDQAADAFSRFHELHPSPESYARLSRLHQEQGEFSEALDYMQQAIDELTRTNRPAADFRWYRERLEEIRAALASR